jgi:hypothetical protein
MVVLDALAVFGLDFPLAATGTLTPVAGVLFMAIQDRDIKSKIERESLIALQPGVDVV